MNNPNMKSDALDFVWILIQFRSLRGMVDDRYARHTGVPHMPIWEASFWNMFDRYLCSFVDSHGGDSSLIDKHGNPIGV